MMKIFLISALIYVFLYDFLLKGVFKIDGGLVVWIAVGISLWLGNRIVPRKEEEKEEPIQIKENFKREPEGNKGKKSKSWGIIVFVVIIFIVPIVIGTVMFGDVASDSHLTEKKVESYSPSVSREEQEILSSLSPDSYEVALFKQDYPMVWGYIQKNTEYPNTYLTTYMEIWGKLQKYHGDGIPFDTLNSYEQTLVNYPKIGSFIYFANSKTTTYHSIQECYELLKSENVVARKTEKLKDYEPCSKCVGDTQHINKVRKMYGFD